VEVSKENDSMKKSILQFRQEFRKKAHQLRDISSSVGYLPSFEQNYQLEQELGLEQTMQQMKLQMNQLQAQLSAVTHKAERQAQLIVMYEEELQKSIPIQHRRPGQFGIQDSSPPKSSNSSAPYLSNVLPETQFEADESLTSSQIL